MKADIKLLANFTVINQGFVDCSVCHMSARNWPFSTGKSRCVNLMTGLKVIIYTATIGVLFYTLFFGPLAKNKDGLKCAVTDFINASRCLLMSDCLCMRIL